MTKKPTLTEITLCEGRPLIEDGVAKTATLMRSGSKWLAGQRPSIDNLSVDDRTVLARHWLQSALFEHASVASFSRFTLELMALGAPPMLLLRVQQAAADEIHHAQLCFSVASTYAGEPLSPGVLKPVGPRTQTLPQLAVSVLLEAAQGETLAAMLAARKLNSATDPVIRDVLQQIVADESRHAELAWETLRWAVHKGGAPVRLAIAEAMAAAELPDVDGAPEHGIPAHGLLSRDETIRVLAEGMVKVIRPAVASLLQA